MESIEELIFVVISLLLLLMGVVFLGSILMSVYNPNQQTTFANVEKLRSSINEECFTQNDKGVTVSFQMPQNTPIMSGIFTVLPAWIIKSSGDPNYVLYYEAFPPGEAQGWEAFHNFNNRILVALPEGFVGSGYDSVQAYAKAAVDQFKVNNENKPIDAVIVDNIVLDNKYKSIFVLKEKPADPQDIFVSNDDQKTKGFFGLGTWQGNFFKFNNYASMSALEKTAIKYMPCGANSLCLKTRDGVYSYPLDTCGNIKNIQLVYDARNRGLTYGIVAGLIIGAVASGGTGAVGTALSWLGGAAESIFGFAFKISKTGTIAGVLYTGDKLVSAVAANFLSFKTSDFYLASPCTMNGAKETIATSDIQEVTDSEGKKTYPETAGTKDITYDFNVKYVNCKKGIITDGWFGTVDPTVCDNVMKYPLYQYNSDGKLEYVKKKDGTIAYHYACVEKIGDQRNTEIAGSDPPTTANDDYYGGNCIQVSASTRPKDFCWTDDGWKRNGGADWDTKLVANIFGLDSIRDATAYIKSENPKINDLIVLKHSPIDQGLLTKIVERKFNWVWPK